MSMKDHAAAGRPAPVGVFPNVKELVGFARPASYILLQAAVLTAWIHSYATYRPFATPFQSSPRNHVLVSARSCIHRLHSFDPWIANSLFPTPAS